MRENCEHCGKEIEDDAIGTIWCTTPLGDATLKTCKTQECGKGALTSRPGWKMQPGNQPKLSKAERDRQGGTHRHQIT